MNRPHSYGRRRRKSPISASKSTRLPTTIILTSSRMNDMKAGDSQADFGEGNGDVNDSQPIPLCTEVNRKCNACHLIKVHP